MDSIHFVATLYILACMVCITTLAIWVSKATEEQATFPPGYSAVEQARAIVERCWEEEEGSPVDL